MIKAIQCWTWNSKFVRICPFPEFQKIQIITPYDYAYNLIYFNQKYDLINLEHDIIITYDDYIAMRDAEFENCGAISSIYKYNKDFMHRHIIDRNFEKGREDDKQADAIGFGFCKFRKGFFEQLGFTLDKKYNWLDFDTIVSQTAHKLKINFGLLPIFPSHLHTF